jgi:RNA polymerase sigma-70 factor (ECF subfamily)
MFTQSVADDLFKTSGAERWGLSRDEFVRALTASVRHGLADDEPSTRTVDRYISGLHVADLALATACALGRDRAWDHFVLQQRPVLYRAADALDPSGGARDLADSLYADLYGTRESNDRGSLLRYFHGRSSLSTWLRAVLSQRYVDRVRTHRRTDPLPDDEPAAPPVPGHGDDLDRRRLVPLVEDSLRAAIEALDTRDRLRLRSYHVAGMTLAQIGRLTGEHEATVSRHLTRIRKALRAAVERHLRTQQHLSPAEIERAFELAIADPERLDLQEMFDGSTDRKDGSRDRSKGER